MGSQHKRQGGRVIELSLHKPKIHNEGIWATHDMACAICHVKSAIMDCQTEVFYPCWECQSKGWQIKKSFLSRWNFFRKNCYFE